MPAATRGSLAAQHVQSVLEERRAAFQRDILKQQEDLRTAGQELDRLRGQLPAEEFARRRREFEQRVIDGNRETQTRNRVLEQALNESMHTINNAMLAIIADIAEQQGANLVLSRAQVVIFDRSLDITPQVIERLNETLPEVPVAIPAQ